MLKFLKNLFVSGPSNGHRRNDRIHDDGRVTYEVYRDGVWIDETDHFIAGAAGAKYWLDFANRNNISERGHSELIYFIGQHNPEFVSDFTRVRKMLMNEYLCLPVTHSEREYSFAKRLDGKFPGVLRKAKTIVFGPDDCPNDVPRVLREIWVIPA